MMTERSTLSVTPNQPLRPPDPPAPQINRGRNISGVEAAKVDTNSRRPCWINIDVLFSIQLAISVENSNASASGPGRISLVETVSP